jgi:hypothetical protein
MNQMGDGSSFVQIGDAGSNNTYNLAQHTAAGSAPSYVQLEVDRDSIQQYPKAQVEKQALRGAISAAPTIVIPLVAGIADWLGILSYLGVPQSYTILIGFGAGFGLTGLSFIVEPSNLTSLRYWIWSTFTRQNEAKHIGLNAFLERDNNGNYLIYRRTACCIYPKCNGKIIIEKLPPREQYCNGLAGLCSVAGKAHSYLIDYNVVATRKELDWRPLDPPSSRR